MDIILIENMIVSDINSCTKTIDYCIKVLELIILVLVGDINY